jgi:hypothetical protein
MISANAASPSGNELQGAEGFARFSDVKPDAG